MVKEGKVDMKGPRPKWPSVRPPTLDLWKRILTKVEPLGVSIIFLKFQGPIEMMVFNLIQYCGS